MTNQVEEALQSLLEVSKIQGRLDSAFINKGVAPEETSTEGEKSSPTTIYSKDIVDAKLISLEENLTNRLSDLESKIDDLPDKIKAALLGNSANFKKNNQIAIWLIVVLSTISALGVLLPILYSWLTYIR